jgi:hypothetical protein
MGEPLSTEAILVACPLCEVWPMVVSTRKTLPVPDLNTDTNSCCDRYSEPMPPLVLAQKQMDRIQTAETP